jgi:hypothetical protein
MRAVKLIGSRKLPPLVAFHGRLSGVTRRWPGCKELRDFIIAHQHCEHMHADLGPETESGYQLWITCECGTELKRWVTPDGDGVRSVLLAL